MKKYQTKQIWTKNQLRFNSTSNNFRLKTVTIFIDYNQFLEKGDSLLFNEIVSHLQWDVQYSYLIRIEKDSIHYATLSERQSFLQLQSPKQGLNVIYHNSQRISHIYEFVYMNINRIFDQYKNFEDRCDVIVFEFTPLNSD
jgi:hypothetical protein